MKSIRLLTLLILFLCTRNALPQSDSSPNPKANPAAGAGDDGVRELLLLLGGNVRNSPSVSGGQQELTGALTNTFTKVAKPQETPKSKAGQPASADKGMIDYDRLRRAILLYKNKENNPHIFNDTAARIRATDDQTLADILKSASGQSTVDPVESLATMRKIREFGKLLEQSVLASRQQRVWEGIPETSREMAVETSERGLLPETYNNFVPRSAPAAPEPFDKGETASEGDAGGEDVPENVETEATSHISIAMFLDELGKIVNASATANPPWKVEFLLEPDIKPALSKPVAVPEFKDSLSRILDTLARRHSFTYMVEAGPGPGERRVVVGRQDKYKNPRSVPRGDELVTYIYQFKNGVQFHASDWEVGSQSATKSTDLIGKLNVNATVSPSAMSKKGESTPPVTTGSYITDILQDFMPQGTKRYIRFDPNTHTVYLRDVRKNIPIAEAILKSMDVTPLQVMIEARFIEIAVADLRELGLEWFLESGVKLTDKNGATKVGIASGGFVKQEPLHDGIDPGWPFGTRADNLVQQGPLTETATQGLHLVTKGILTEPMFQMVLHAIEVSGKGKTISVPRVTTVNNSPAKLRHGQKFFYYEEYKVESADIKKISGGETIIVNQKVLPSQIKDEDLGITLIAVPSVGKDGRSISLILNPKITRLEDYNTYGAELEVSQDLAGDVTTRKLDIKLPIFSTREVQTKVVVESGQTIVMGGLIDSIMTETVNKVPILSAIPLIGKLFQRQDLSEERTNLLIFVTATVLNPKGEYVVDPSARPPEGFSVPRP